MAIRAPDYIMPDAVGSNLKAFEVADRSARDYARIMLEQQRFAQQAVESAKKAKADDWRQMFEMMKHSDDQAQRRIANEQRDRALNIQSANSDTTLYRALNPRSSSARDPNAAARAFLGMAPVAGEEASIYSEPAAAGVLLPSGEDPGVSEGGPVATLFGAPSGEPDMDLPAGGQGDQQDLISAQNDPIPVPPSTPVPRAVPVAEVVAEEIEAPAAPAAPPRPGPELTSQQILRAMTGEYVPPASRSFVEGATGMMDSAMGPALQAVESAMPSSFARADVTQQDRNNMLALFKENAEIKQRITTARSKAVQAAGYLRTVTDPALAGQLSQVRDQAALEAEKAAGEAIEAQYRATELQKQQALNQQRQDKIAALAHMDDIMPGSERMEIINDAQDPRKAAIADRKIAVLNVYDTIRQQENLTHKSNGIKTAEKVARLGLELRSPAALKDKEDFDKAKVYENLIARNEASEEKKSRSTVETWENKLAELTAGAAQWESRERAFKNAVEADRVKEVEETTVRPDQIRTNPAPVAPARPVDVVAEAEQRRASRPNADTMTPEDDQYWSTAKNILFTRAGGRDAIVDWMSRTRNPVMNESDMKDVFRAILTQDATSESAGSEGSWSERINPRLRGLPGLPKNANSWLDVADALAEDYWRATGRTKDGRAVPGAPAVNPESRARIDALKAKIDSTR
jgi:hypothetical protein